MTVHFILARPNSETQTAIMCRILDKGKQKRFSTKLSIHPKLWDKEEKAPVKSDNVYLMDKHSSRSQHRNLIRDFNLFKTHCLNFIEAKETAKEPFANEDLVAYLNSHYKPFMNAIHLMNEKEQDARETERLQKESEKLISSYFEKYIEGLESGAIMYRSQSGKRRYMPNTIKGYKTCLRAYKEFEQYSEVRYTFGEFDAQILDKCENFLIEQKKYRASMQGTFFKNLQTVFYHANENPKFKHDNRITKNFTIARPSIDNVFLRRHELELLHEADLSESPTMDKVRDAFLLGCYTALRFDQYSNITKADFIFEDGILCLKKLVNKTGRAVKVPIDDRALSLLQKNDFNFTGLSNPVVNRYIKLVCKKAGINHDVKLIRVNEYGRENEVIKPKCEWITTHTARRTCISNLYLDGMPVFHLMVLSGHQTEKAFREYLKLESEDMITEYKAIKAREKASAQARQSHLKAV